MSKNTKKRAVATLVHLSVQQQQSPCSKTTTLCWPQAATSGLYQRLWERSVQYEDNSVSDLTEAYDRVYSSPYVFFGDLSLLRSQAHTNCQFVLGKDTFYPAAYAFLFPEHSPYLPVINAK